MFGFGGARGFQLGVVLEAKNLLKAEMRRVKGDTDEAKRKIAGLQGQLRQLERYGKMMRIGAGITALGAAASVMTVKVVDANNRIAESTGKLGAIMAPTYAEWAAMEDEVREKLERLTVDYVGSYDQMREAAYELKSAGLTEEEMWAGAPHAIEAALATEGDYRETAKTMGMITNNFRKDLAGLETESERFEHIGDLMAIATREFAITGPAIAQGFAYATGPAKEWGMSLEETVTVLGALNTAGLEGGMAGTALMATWRNMAKAEDELGISIKKGVDGSVAFVDVLDAIAEKYGENIVGNEELKKKLQEVYGDEGKKAIVNLLEHRDRIREVTEAMEEEKRVAHEMMKAINETDAAKVERLADSWDVFKASLMKDSNVVDWAVESLTDLVQTLDAMPDWAKELAATGMAVGGVAGSVAGPAMMGFGGMMQWRLAKAIKGGGVGGGIAPVRTFETHPAAIGGGGIGKAGVAGAAGGAGRWKAGGGILGFATSVVAPALIGWETVKDLIPKIAGDISDIPVMFEEGLGSYIEKRAVATWGEETVKGPKGEPEREPKGPSSPYAAAVAAYARAHPAEAEKLYRQYEKSPVPVSAAGGAVTVGSITIHTQAKNADEIAREIGKALASQRKRTGTKGSP